MNANPTVKYTPSLTEKTRVRLLKENHPETSRVATLLRALPNPSGRAEHQWYDVRFDDGFLGRFLERYLERVEENGQVSAA